MRFYYLNMVITLRSKYSFNYSYKTDKLYLQIQFFLIPFTSMLSDENGKKVLNENSKNIQGFSKIGLHNVNRKNSKIFNGCELMKL